VLEEVDRVCDVEALVGVEVEDRAVPGAGRIAGLAGEGLGRAGKEAQQDGEPVRQVELPVPVRIARPLPAAQLGVPIVGTAR